MPDNQTTERQRIMEEAARICEKQIEAFLSSQYALGQPMSSFGERFGCAACAREIRRAAGLTDPHERGDSND